MTTSTQSLEQIAYRVAIVLPHSKEIMAESDGDSLRLPTVTIQRWDRIAEQITANVKARWSLQTVVVDSAPSTDGSPCVAILEFLSCGVNGGHTMRPCHLDEISIDTKHRELLQEFLGEKGGIRSPLLQLGWIDQAKRWLQANIRDREIQFDGDIRQLNSGAGFALIRLGALVGPAYWIKAAGAPNRHEVAITETLSECSPSFLPPLVAVHRTWNAWAMEEVGTALTDVTDVRTISLVSLNLARLQQQTTSHGKSLLDCGCGDQRTKTLRGYLPAFIDGVDKLAVSTTLENPVNDIAAILAQLETTLRAALDEIRDLRIPNTINNNDMKLANILFDGRRCVFTDWCHAHWGNPFLTFQHLQTYLARRLPDLATPFQNAYSEAWTTFLSEVQIQRMLTLAPVVAPYAYICGRGTESLASRVSDPGFRKLYLRIVERIMVAGDHLNGKEGRTYV